MKNRRNTRDQIEITKYYSHYNKLTLHKETK
uniref:Ribosomal protein L33 n=1 Tax=Rhizosolenia imbricata TaxID=216768 RepID=A0A089VP22_9STRA|nr:ribosomal protein L33 [Rhizosolenia imbricata]AIR75713.1 ribosomal protein L33 [Rhizosolenia imbricata]